MEGRGYNRISEKAMSSHFHKKLINFYFAGKDVCVMRITS